MKKIIGGFLGLALTLVLVSGVAYGLFSDSVTVSGNVLGTATPGLLVGLEGSEGTFYQVTPTVGSLFAPLLPGESDWGEFWLWNDSDGEYESAVGPLDMDLFAQISAVDTSTAARLDGWNTLKNVVEARICLYDEPAVLNCDLGNRTAWHTLYEWKTVGYDLPGPLMQTEKEHYAINLRIDASYGNEIAGKTIRGLDFEVIGTQVSP